MAYLSYDEFIKLGFEMKKDKFDSLLSRAENQISLVTMRYYEFHNFDDDFEFRIKAYKWAIAYQVEYMLKQKVSSADDVANKPVSTSQSMGGTTVSKSYPSKASSETETSSAVSVESINQLRSTGLLYRGIKHGRIS